VTGRADGDGLAGRQVAVEVADRHARPAGGERAGGREADPARATGHRDDESGDLATLGHGRDCTVRGEMDWQDEGLLDGCADDASRDARRALLDKLHADGVPVEELRRAAAEDRLALVPVERLLTSDVRYSAHDIAEQTGLDLDFFLAQRRALGLAMPGPEQTVYGEQDLESARMGHQYRQAGLPDDEALEAQRVLGRGMARYVEAVTSLVGQAVLEEGTDEHEVAMRLEAVSKMLLPLAGPWLAHVFALHLREALRQEVITAEQMASGRLDSGRDTAVAFADIVGFTELGETIPVEELGSVAGRLSKRAEEVIEPPVKLVKEIGDAVMLVSPEPAPLVDAALALVSDEEEGLPAIRAGVAFGPAVNRWGDWYGSTVNVASRLTGRARPSSVLATEAVQRAAGAFDWSFAGEKKLKGVSQPVRTYRARLTATSDG
jgi:adenylate cyclase